MCDLTQLRPAAHRGTTRRFLCRTSPALWTHNMCAGDSCSTQFASVDESDRVSFWQDLVASTAHVVSVLPHSTLILSGDANVRHPHFSLDRMRSRDNAIFPYIQQLLDMGLTIRNPRSSNSESNQRWIWCLFPAIRSLISSLSIRVMLIVPTAPFAVPA